MISNSWQFLNLQEKKGKIVDNTMHAVITPMGLLKLQDHVGGGASEALEHLLVTALN